MTLAQGDLRLINIPDPVVFWRVEKMRFGGKQGAYDRSVIHYNHNLTLTGVPLEAYDYVVNGKSAIEWVMEWQGVRTDTASGITKDAMMQKMTQDAGDAVIGVNLTGVFNCTSAVLPHMLEQKSGVVLTTSSVVGIYGNLGQTNYAFSKAGVIGMVQSHAPLLAERGITINAVAPGFIETQMTAAIPFTIREAGRRMNSMGQGGLPVDVAETIAWLASPASSGLNGNVVRVCGQSLLGA